MTITATSDLKLGDEIWVDYVCGDAAGWWQVVGKDADSYDEPVYLIAHCAKQRPAPIEKVN